MLKRGIFRPWVVFFLFIAAHGFLFGQEIITADRYLEMVSEHYGTIQDYEASVVIRSGNNEMTGNLSHRSPSSLRIDFSKPADQVIVFDGELLQVYLPEFRVALNQRIEKGSSRASTTGGLASAQGLAMLRKNYVASYDSGPNPVPLENNSRERVVKIRLTRRSISEGFREIILSVNNDTKLIRRIEGRTIADSEVSFDFTSIKVNQGIPEQRFIYDSPASANIYNNFLYKDD